MQVEEKSDESDDENEAEIQEFFSFLLIFKISSSDGIKAWGDTASHCIPDAAKSCYF